MGATIGLLWIAVWFLLLLLAVTRSAVIYRRELQVETAKKVTATCVFKTHRWRARVLPLAGVALAAIATGESPVRRFVERPELLAGAETAALSLSIVYLLLFLLQHTI